MRNEQAPAGLNVVPSGMDHVSVCICTFRRPQRLHRLLLKLENQETRGLFGYSAVVVDNDPTGSAASVVAQTATAVCFPVRYAHEPQRSIAAARNRSVREAMGNLIAFIDDDEFPDSDWLFKMYRCLRDSQADGVLGPVLPHFEANNMPVWLVKSGILHRARFPEGHVIDDSRHTRTGNVLLHRTVFKEGEVWFDLAYGLAGGSDAVFFGRMMKEGHRFVWCDSAPVFETVPPERQSRAYYLRRAFTRGMTAARSERLLSFGSLKSIVALLLYVPVLPLLYVVAEHLFFRYLVSSCDHLSKLLAHVGVRPISERPYATQNGN
jgi:glycosyltransferase involved in cell wall biosynthesis